MRSGRVSLFTRTSGERIIELDRGKVLMPDLPVVCTLGPQALATRREGLLADLVGSAITHEELDSGHRLTFAATDEALALILKTVTSERHCCQFLRFQITVEPAGGPISLELTGPHGTKEFVAALLPS